MSRVLSLLLAAACADEAKVAYFRFGNYDDTSALDSVSSDARVQLREWHTGFKIFDSSRDVKVQRLDLSGEAGATVTLYGDRPLSFYDGPAYVFSNASAVKFEDHTGQVTSMQHEDSVAWVSHAACLKIHADLDASGAASLIVVSSGQPAMSGETDTTSCAAATVLVGTPALSRNEVSYKISPAGSCKDGLNHGSEAYSNLDVPIRPLQAHYHTRGALYYVLEGHAEYNDADVEDSFLLGGELRYVAPGVWYGPETMTKGSYVASLHEVDPAAIVTSSPPSPIPNNCAFACLDKDDVAPGLCVKEDTLAEVTQV